MVVICLLGIIMRVEILGRKLGRGVRGLWLVKEKRKSVVLKNVPTEI